MVVGRAGDEVAAPVAIAIAIAIAGAGDAVAELVAGRSTLEMEAQLEAVGPRHRVQRAHPRGPLTAPDPHARDSAREAHEKPEPHRAFRGRVMGKSFGRAGRQDAQRM